MANTKSKKTTAAKSKKTDNKAVTAKTEPVKAEAKASKGVETEVKAEKKEAVIASKDTSFKGVMKGFFAKKFDPTENILTIFSRPSLYGALIGEVIGTMLLTMVVICLGMTNPLYMWFAVVAITVAVFGLSGAHLNPIITVGMMATRRMSAIRGVLYILAQVLGAWIGMAATSGLSQWAESAAEMPKMAEVAEGTFWQITIIELIGAILFAFFFARAWSYRKSPLTFGMIVGTGLAVTVIYIYIVSQSYFGYSNNFMMNPAIALMHQILPSSGENFGEIIGAICQALATYVLFPMIGGVVGFYIADFAGRLAGECACCGKKHCICDKKMAAEK